MSCYLIEQLEQHDPGAVERARHKEREVINLLKDMGEQLEKEGKEDEEVFEKVRQPQACEHWGKGDFLAPSSCQNSS